MTVDVWKEIVREESMSRLKLISRSRPTLFLPCLPAASALLQKHGFGRTLSPSAFTLHACVENGVQLAEALIRYGQEGFAATILAEVRYICDFVFVLFSFLRGQ